MIRTSSHVAPVVALLGVTLLSYAPGDLAAQDDTGTSSSETDAPEMAHLEAKRAIAAEICEGADNVEVNELGVTCIEPYESPADREAPSLLHFYDDLFSSGTSRTVLVGVEASAYGGTPVLYRHRALLFRETSDGWRQLDSVHLDLSDCRPVSSENHDSLLVCASNRQVKMSVAARLTAVRVREGAIEETELIGFGHGPCHGTHHCRPGEFASGRVELAEEAWSPEADPPVVAAKVEAEYVVEKDGCDPEEPDCTAYRASFMQKDGSRRQRDFRKKAVTLLLRYELVDGRLEVVDEDRSDVEIFEGESAPP